MAFTGKEVKTTVTATAVTYHQTVVAELVDGGIRLNSGDWHTATTKKRINQALEHFGFRDRVWSNTRKGGWLIGASPGQLAGRGLKLDTPVKLEQRAKHRPANWPGVD